MGLFDEISAVAKTIGVNAAGDNAGGSAIEHVVGELYGKSSGDQQAAVLNHVVGLLGPNATTLLGNLLGQASVTEGATITPEQAAQISPAQVQAFMTEAAQHLPALSSHLGDFYSQHTDLLNALSGPALAMISSGLKRT